MPHCIVEYSKNLSEKVSLLDIKENLKEIVIASNLFNPSAVKVRSISFEDYLLPEKFDYFVHICLKILSGRDEQQRIDLAKNIQDFLISKTNQLKISVTTEILEMDENTYQKT